MMNDHMKTYIPSLIAGFIGAFVCLVLVGFGGALFLSASPIQTDLRARFSGFIDQIVTEQRLLDSAGNQSDVVDVVDAVNPAVVSIVITKDVPKLERIMDQGARSPFGFFSFPQYRQNGTEEKEIGGGSGFLVSADGYIVTNAHVVNDADANYTVYFNDETQHDAEVVASDSALDIAVLKIDANDVPFLEFGDSDTVRVGQTVIAIGNALAEFRNTVSVGVISGLSRSITASGGGSSEFLPDVLQTDAAINPGNSGGPLLDLGGKVIGVNVATSSGGENISFSLPSNAVRAAVESIRTNGYVVQAYLGVRYVMISEAMAEVNALPVDHGALIRRGDGAEDLAVIPGSPADKAGIEENDIITHVDDISIDDDMPLHSVLRQKAVGDSVELRLWHDGDERTVSVVLEERPLAE